MKGVLLGAFCERGGIELTRCLELWAYPDTTLNVVVNRFGPEGEEEYAFPCALHNLVGVLQHRPFKQVGAAGTVAIERNGDSVTALYRSADGSDGWRHSVPVETFISALVQIAPEASLYLE